MMAFSRSDGATRIMRYSMSACWSPSPRGGDAQRIALEALGQRRDRLAARWPRTSACGGSAGAAARMNSRSSRKPRSSISSASSSTTARSAEMSSEPRVMWSRSRPGVPTTMLRALFERAALLAHVHAADAGSDARAGLLVEPFEFAPHLERQFAGRRDDERAGRARRRRSRSAPPSRVGAMAMPKATVLPEPVCAETSRSAPSASGASTAVCTGVSVS